MLMHLFFIFHVSLLIIYLPVSLPKFWTNFLLDAAFTKANQKSGDKEEIMLCEDTHMYEKNFFYCAALPQLDLHNQRQKQMWYLKKNRSAKKKHGQRQELKADSRLYTASVLNTVGWCRLLIINLSILSTFLGKRGGFWVLLAAAQMTDRNKPCFHGWNACQTCSYAGSAWGSTILIKKFGIVKQLDER